MDERKSFIKEFMDVVSGSKLSMLAAQIGFFLLLAFFPFCILLFIILGQIRLGETIFISSIESFLPPQIAPLMGQILDNARSNANIFWSLAGILTTIWVSTRAAHAMIAAVDSFYDKEERWPLTRRLGLAALLMAGLVIFILLSMAFVILGRGIINQFFGLLGLSPLNPVLASVIRISSALIALTAFFTVLYTISTKSRIRLWATLPGALFSSVIWFALTYFFSEIISRFFVLESIYGGIGSIILMMMWLFWGSHVIVLGAAMNKTIQNRVDRKRV